MSMLLPVYFVLPNVCHISNLKNILIISGNSWEFAVTPIKLVR